MNDEMERELLFHSNVHLQIWQADANSQLQCLQLDSIVALHPDLIIVSPNEAAEVEPAITRAFDKGIPIIVADRKVNGNNYTAFIGGDNYEIGQLLAQYIIAHCPTPQCSVFEITGLLGSTPAVLRHQGLIDGLQTHPQVKITAQANGQWFEGPAYAVALNMLQQNPKPHFIVAHNDLMAIGASKAVEAVYPGVHIPIIGVDALSGKGLGLEAICDGVEDASAIYAPHGDLIIQTAMAILRGEPYKKDIILPTFMMDKEGALAMRQYADEMNRRVETIRLLQNKVSDLTKTLSMQRILVYALVVLIGMVLVILAILHNIYKYRKRVREERERTQRTIAEQQQRLEDMSTELARVQATMSSADKFMQQLMREIEMRMADTDLNVKTLSDAMNISRAQLFRKVKTLTGCSPVDLIRSIRLKRGQQLLLNTDDSIQQIAYAVGFTSPSYFTKCYKDMFGTSPGEVKRPK